MKQFYCRTLILVYSLANGMTYYVSPDGIDHANYGTIEKPRNRFNLASINSPFGDTLIILGRDDMKKALKFLT